MSVLSLIAEGDLLAFDIQDENDHIILMRGCTGWTPKKNKQAEIAFLQDRYGCCECARYSETCHLQTAENMSYHRDKEAVDATKKELLDQLVGKSLEEQFLILLSC